MIRVSISGSRPARRDTGRQHRGVLAGTVHVHPVSDSALAKPGVPRRFVERQVGRALQVRLGQPGRVQDPGDAADVKLLARMTCRCQREQFALQPQSAAQHRHRLHRLIR
jgi:hypothetical protein